MLPIIYSVVRQCSTIYTDDYRSYISLGNFNNHEHKVVVNKYHFVDPATGVHTQNVESFNNIIKGKIKQMRDLTDSGRR